MFYKSDWAIFELLLGIKQGLERNYDFVLVVSGDTGTGKSVFVMHLVEAWLKLNGKSVTKDDIRLINVDKLKWLNQFKELEHFDINVFDEGAAGLGSKQYMETFSKTLEMLFQVIRYKRFFTIIIVPNFFRLNKFFREDRLRGMFYINKRGEYKYYSRDRVQHLCEKNSRYYVKKMDFVQPLFRGKFPDYDGVLLNAYDNMKEEGVNNILDEVIELNTEKKKGKNQSFEIPLTPTLKQARWDVLKTYKKKTTTRKDIAKLAEERHVVPIGDYLVKKWLTFAKKEDYEEAMKKGSALKKVNKS